MNVVHSFNLGEETGKQVIGLPQDAKFLSARFEGRSLVIFCEVEKHAQLDRTEFFIVRTGEEVPPEADAFLKSIHSEGYTCHLFTREEYRLVGDVGRAEPMYGGDHDDR